MESKVRVATWNVCGAMNDDNRAQRATEEVKALNSGVIVLPEAVTNDHVSEKTLEHQGSTLETLYSEGYTYNIFACNYEDPHEGADYRPSYSLWVLSRLAARSCVRRAGTRNYLSLDITENRKDPLRIDGVHLDDRSEENRINAVRDLGNQNFDVDSPRVIAGDFNAMDKEDGRAKIYRSKAFKTLARLTPQGRLRYAGKRLHEMGYGTSMSLMSELGFEDVNTQHQPTALLGRFALLAHLDKIYIHGTTQLPKTL